MTANAFLLSGIYLAAGTGVELVRRVSPARWAFEASRAIDALPARILQLTGLLVRMQESYQNGQLSDFQLRIIFAVTGVGFIFALAMLVGAGTWTVRYWWNRLQHRGGV